MRETVTGLVLTYNGERLLENCLKSLDFCDEILVVDSESTDRTRQIAEEFGARIIINPWPGPVAQFALALSEIQTDWVVSLDQDEYLTDELRHNIIDKLSEDVSLAGYYTPRSSFYFNRFMKHSGWYPDYLFRFFRHGKMQVTASGAHYHFTPLGETAQLRGDILHYPYESFEQHMDKINYYAEEGAKSLREKGKKGGLSAGILHATMKFIKLYFLKAGFLDGKAGFYNAMAGYYYTFQKYIRVEETNKWGTP
ncbi:glycosyltransferase family 2 protein [Pseudodesulfovibrio piezophilus]|uniref:Glycosyl transferase family 2 n=1 Tax=Pseudodesulfovibrio piezophilus (strain DSM 21447 / JCM 15486 / C1TLV30) TaxID=1322246 RepID=M1WNM6_PSEP2|nr:glycosyltransferase family 2 protein [Pseudodesulfovibrio piezophilus]CCH50445.1 Glycosyl transferase family 2 [Pseudodesulfovibrio piezophilus C1TLV30]